MTPHGQLCADICTFLKEHEIYYVRTNSHGYGRKGIPDILACYQGKFVAIEAKVGKDHLTPWQERELVSVRTAGGIALEVRSVQDLGAIFV